MNPHENLGPYALELLDAAAHESFERHLNGCADCRVELAQMQEAARLLEVAAPPFEAPPGLEQRAIDAVRAANANPSAGFEPRLAPAPAPRRRWFDRPLLPALGAAVGALLLGAVLGLYFSDTDDGPSGPVEIRGSLVSPARDAVGSVTVTMLGIGRDIDFFTDDLAILPKGEYYELWFVGPDDTPSSPNRISAGTFHPDENGVSDVSFTAAVDPAQYPTIEITAEPGDGDPTATGKVVMRLKSGSDDPHGG